MRKKTATSPYSSLTGGLLVLVTGAGLLVALSGSALVLTGFFVLTFGVGAVNVQSIHLRQLLVPHELSGRVNTILKMLILGGMPLSEGSRPLWWCKATG